MSSQKLRIFLGKQFSHIKESVGLDINVTLQVSERPWSFRGKGGKRERENCLGEGDSRFTILEKGQS